MLNDFICDPQLFYSAQQAVIEAERKMMKKRNCLNDCINSIPENYEYKNEITTVCNNISEAITSVAHLERKISEAKDRLINLDNYFAAGYYQCTANKYSDIEGNVDNEQQIYYEYFNEKYNESLYNYLTDLNKQGLLTDEQKKIYNYLKISSDLSNLENELSKMDVNSNKYKKKSDEYNKKLEDFIQLQIKDLESKDVLTEEEKKQLKDLKNNSKLKKLQSELDELNKNPVKNPGIAASRMSQSEAIAYQKKVGKYTEYLSKKKELQSKIDKIQKELHIYQNKWYEDLGEAVIKTGSAWKTAWKTKNVDDVVNATKQTIATGAVVYVSARSGVEKINEMVLDGVALAGGSALAGATWLLHDTWSDNDVAGNVMDWTLDQVRRDRVGEANKEFYEKNPTGKWINKNSNLKYDSAGAQAIQGAGEFVGKIAIATAATVASGGAAAPIVIGALYGAGKAGEKYAQSVERNNGESYNYAKALLKSTAGAVAGAAEFYGYGQMGTGMLGVNISPQASTSFVKNFLTRDTLLDSVSVVTDHGVNVAFGDETWQHALLYGGAEFALALGMNAIGARQASKSANTITKTDVNIDDLNYYFSLLSDEEKRAIRSSDVSIFETFSREFSSPEDLANYFGDPDVYIFDLFNSKLRNMKDVSYKDKEELLFQYFNNGPWATHKYNRKKVLDFLDLSDTELNKVNKMINDYEQSIEYKWLQTLSEKEKNAVLSYTRRSGFDVNKFLRGQDVGVDYTDLIERLDSAVSKQSELITEPIKVYRGVDLDAFGKDINSENINDLIGTVFSDKGYMSTSVLKENAYIKEAVIEIDVPPGTNGAYIESLNGCDYKYGQTEFLLGRDSNLLIKSAEVGSNGKIFIKAEVVK